MYDTQH